VREPPPVVSPRSAILPICASSSSSFSCASCRAVKVQRNRETVSHYRAEVFNKNDECHSSPVQRENYFARAGTACFPKALFFLRRRIRAVRVLPIRTLDMVHVLCCGVTHSTCEPRIPAHFAGCYSTPADMNTEAVSELITWVETAWKAVFWTPVWASHFAFSHLRPHVV
jgi:hypothetical protein